MRKPRDTGIVLVPYRDLPPDWNGWRFSHNTLIAPSGERITVERLRGLLWRDATELRRAGYASRRAAEAGQRSAKYGPKVKVVIVDLADLRLHGRAVG